MPKLICGLLYCAMLTMYDNEKSMLASYWPPDNVEPKEYGKLGPLGNFVLLLLSHLYDLKSFTLNLPHYF